MHIIFPEKFIKKYQKLQKSSRVKVDTAIERFTENPFEPSLKNHNLQGKMKGYKSIKA